MNFEIFGIENCIHCDHAKDAGKLGFVKSSKYQLLPKAEMKRRGYETAPAVYLNGEYIGGFDEMLAVITKHSLLLLEALHLCGVKEWDGYTAAAEMVEEWKKAGVAAEELDFEGEEL